MAESKSSTRPAQRQICTWVEFGCEICGKHVAKWWHPRYLGKPRFCSIACKAESQRRNKPVTKEWLQHQYVILKRDCPDIAREVNRDAKSVWNWLRGFGIPTRPRGYDWKKNLKVGSGRDNAFFGKKHSRKTRVRLRAIAVASVRIRGRTASRRV